MKPIPINFAKLKKYCLMPENKLIPDGQYNFIDRGGSILGVAHCDYICTGSVDATFYNYKKDTYIQSEALDDRLGVYLIMDVLPEIGINCDVLLTTDEEVGASTASLFESKKEYNWIFSFDRRGTDIVLYDYEDDDITSKVKLSTGQLVSFGSFSDIVELEHLGVKGLNFGCGYHNEHTVNCWAGYRSISKGVSNFIRFHNVYKDIKLPHVSYAGRRKHYGSYIYDTEWESGYGYGNRGRYNGATDAYRGTCEYCAGYLDLHYNNLIDDWICDDCSDMIIEHPKKSPSKHEECHVCGLTEMDGIISDYTNPYTGEQLKVCEFCISHFRKMEKSENAEEFFTNVVKYWNSDMD